MKILVTVLIFIFCSAALSENITTADPSKSSQDTTTLTPTTTSDTQTTSEASSSTIVVPTASPSTESPSTSEAPVTTSEAPVTTSEAPATTVSPTKAPEPEKCTWNATCIQAVLKAEFIVPIKDKEHTIVLGCNATSEQSDCSSNETQTLILYEPNYYNLTMIFEKEDNSIFVRNISFTYTLPEGHDDVANNSENILKVKAGNSYLCKSEFDVKLENVTMKISEVHIQAFLEKGSENFGSAEECEADDKVSDIVPIAVGVALGALIIIVLIAYLIGRRRSRQKGYQSV